MRTAAALSLLLTAGLLCLATSPVSASSAGDYTYDTIVDHSSAGGSMVGGGAATRVDSRPRWADPAGSGPRGSYDSPTDLLAPSAARVFDFRRASVNGHGTDLVESHLLRFADDGVLDPAEAGMLDRLRRISSGDLVASDYDLAFYTHELRELTLYRQAGYPIGQPSSGAYEFWDALHTQALSDYGFTRADGLDVLYHPSVRG